MVTSDECEINAANPARVDDTILQKCLCAKCGQYLSYPPIMVEKNRYIHEQCCNRSPEVSLTVRAEAYEALASYFTFPCVNKFAGCEEHIQFGLQAFDHISQCLYQPLQCVFRQSKACTWKGGLLNFAQHFQESHPEFYLERPVIIIDSNLAQELNHLIVVDGVTIILQTKCDLEGKMLWFNASSLPLTADIPSASYSIKLTPGEVLKPSLEIATKPINPLMNTVMDLKLCQRVRLGIFQKMFKTSVIHCHWTLTAN